MSGGTANAVVGETFRGHDFGIVQVAPVNHDGILHLLAEAVEIEVGEFLPLGEDQQSVGAAGRLVSRVSERDAGRHYFPGSLHGSGIVGCDLTALLQERLHKEECRGFADVVGPALEGEAEHGQVFCRAGSRARCVLSAESAGVGPR